MLHASPAGRPAARPDARPPRAALAATVLLGGAAALHVAWGLGSPWPAPDRTRLAQLSSGQDDMPPAAACFTVATLLAAASAAVLSPPASRLGRLARVGVLAAFAVRGLTGVTGTTGVLVPWSPSEEFTHLDRRRYGPSCLVVAGLVAAGALDARDRSRSVRPAA